MEDPILNKEAADFEELFGISDERKEELLQDVYFEVKTGYTILAKTTSTFLNRAKTINEQLFLMTHIIYMLGIMQSKGMDVTTVITEDAGEDDEIKDIEIE